MIAIMGDDRTLSALGRIERALARIQAAAERQASSPAPADDGELRQAHETLKSEVGHAIARIDRLLASAEAD